MDFKKFNNSAFLYLGHSRFDYYSGYNFIQRDTILFETSLMPELSQHELDNFNESQYRPGSLANAISLVHLRKVLTLNDPNFLDFEFKKEIGRQWVEVSNIIKQLPMKPKSSMLLINKPGVVIPKHQHGKKQTLTFCYKFDDDKSSVFENSCLILGKDGERQVNFIDSNKFYFMFRDDIPHEVRSNEWRFFWFHDYTEYMDIPDSLDIPFTYQQI
jgi:hypothetical protein